MHASVLYLVILTLQGTLPAAGNPCSPGIQVADECYEVTLQGCCTNQKTVRWCQGGVLCELSCADKPACGWKAGAGLYDCGTKPAGDPSCANPYSCIVDGCAPAWEQKGCCGCPCESCVCSKDPYCCQVSWDPVCVAACADCGGCGSPDGCTPAPTPGCNGCPCQDCVCTIDDFCCTGKWDSLCSALCANECDGGCEVCQPDCGGKECGSDGCLGLCGICAPGFECKAGKCTKQCVPSCAGRECGLDSCGLKSCGSCPADYECNKYQKCVAKPCEPSCEGKLCGNDGCGGSCGECDEDVPCIDGECVPGACMPQCSGKQCGPDGCGGECGYCDPGTICDPTLGKCKPYCKPNCLGKQCGNDGCGGVCGLCNAGLQCEVQDNGTSQCTAPCFPHCEAKQCGPDYCGGECGACSGDKPACSQLLGYNCVAQADCQPNCLGRECGDDGCGGSCGQCPGAWVCDDKSGTCVPQCVPQCLVPPQYLAYKQCGWDECPGQNVCGVCPPGHYCAPGYVCVEDKCSCEGKQCGVPADGCPSCGDCGENESCDPLTSQCVACQPSCEGKACGDDGCGGSCGDCPPGYTCDEDELDGDPADFQCQPCVPNCLNSLGQVKQCGDDGCGGSCGACPPSKPLCDDAQGEGVCVECAAQCEHPLLPGTIMECGPNNCPAGCLDVGLKPCKNQKDCDPGQQCNAVTGMCVACGSCGSCPMGWICDVETEIDPEIYVCEICTPNCNGKECGDNGCGGMCGVCPNGFDCIEGLCIKECNPTAGCFGKECGPNGCPHGCMENGTEECGPFGACPEGTLCDPNENMCVPCSGNCGQCSEGEYCAPGYICMPKPDLCDENGWECGDDGAGTSCGDCPAGKECVDHECILVEVDIVEDTGTEPEVDVNPECPDGYIWTGQECEKETIECPDGQKLVDGQCVPDEAANCPTGAEYVNGQCICPPGTKPFFNKCVPTEEEVKTGGGGCSCALYEDRTASEPAWFLLVGLGLALYLALRRQRRSA
jgi:hypothetical protein